MEKIVFNKDWDFYESNESTGFMIWERPEPKKIDLPHDFIIEKGRSAEAEGGAANAFFPGGEGVYKKVFEAPLDWQGKSVVLDIDGAYMNAEVELNGEVLALHPYGYSPFLVDLTDHLKIGEQNRLKIITQSRQPSTRWYSGGGLYRQVSLWIGGSVFVKPWDVFVTTPALSADQAVVCFETTFRRLKQSSSEIEVHYEIFDANNNLVTSCTSTEYFVDKDSKSENVVEMIVKEPQLWDLNNPYQYQYQITVLQDGAEVDHSYGKFGIRETAVSVEEGFTLNGRALNLQGGCIHHDNGLLGACAYPEAEKRKIRLLRDCGYNAVRISHNPPSLDMLEACDELGMLVLDECFDSWRLGKSPLDYHLYFEDWWQRDLEAIIKRERNHPCVISYSIGNEIAERNGKNNGPQWSKMLCDAIRSLDSTRFIMSGLCGVFEEDEEPGSNFDANTNSDDKKWARVTEAFCEPLDVVGYNYLPARYEADHELFPDRIIVGSESHAFTTYEYWQAVKKYPYVIGDFIWAAVDYLGEVGVGKVYWDQDNEKKQFMANYPWRTSWQSDLMLTGERRPQSYYRELMWEETKQTYLFTTHPKHYQDNFFGFGWHWYDVDQTWTFSDEYVGKYLTVSAYSRGTEVEFFINGKSMGTVACDQLIASIDLPYEPGVLEAVSYCNGKEISRTALYTIGQDCELQIVAEKDIIELSDEIAFLQVAFADSRGTIDRTCNEKIEVVVSGCASLLAVGSGNPVTDEKIGGQAAKLFKGTGQIILKLKEAGQATVQVSAEGFSTQKLCFNVKPEKEQRTKTGAISGVLN